MYNYYVLISKATYFPRALQLWNSLETSTKWPHKGLAGIQPPFLFLSVPVRDTMSGNLGMQVRLL